MMVTTKQKPVVDTQKIMRKEHNHNTKRNHQSTREENKRRRKEQRGTTKTARKQLTLCHYANGLNVNGLNSLMERHRGAEWIFFKRHMYMLPKRDLLQKKKD